MFEPKNLKNIKCPHAYKGYVSSYNVETTQRYWICNQRKLIDLLFECKVFKFVTTLVLGFNKTRW